MSNYHDDSEITNLAANNVCLLHFRTFFLTHSPQRGWRYSFHRVHGIPTSSCIKLNIFLGFEVLTAVVMKSAIFWDLTLCSPLRVNWRVGGTYSLHLLATCFHTGFLLGLFFYPEDGGDMFLRNVGWLSTDYTTLNPRKWYSSYIFLFVLNVGPS
jgi:hypothetical protein